MPAQALWGRRANFYRRRSAAVLDLSHKWLENKGSLLSSGRGARNNSPDRKEINLFPLSFVPYIFDIGPICGNPREYPELRPRVPHDLYKITCGGIFLFLRLSSRFYALEANTQSKLSARFQKKSLLSI